MKKLSLKLIIFVGVSVIVVSLTIGLSSFYFLFNLANKQAHHLETTLMTKYDEEIRWQTEQANSMLNALGKLRDEGKLDRETAFTLAQTLLNSLRYGQEGYFWADTVEGVNVVHGSKPENIGRNRMNDVDAKGFKLIEAIITAGKNGGGYTDYWYPKLGSNEPEPKRGYSLLNPAFNWVLGTGNYYDDIHKAVEAQKAVTYREVQGIVGMILVLIIVITFVILIVAAAATRLIIRPVLAVTNGLKEISCGAGDLTKKLPVYGNDEVAQLSHYFNEFIASLNQTMVLAKNAANSVLQLGEQLKSNSDRINLTTKEIKQSIEDMNRKLDTQTQSVSGTSSAVEQIVRNIESLAQLVETQAANVTESSASIEEMVGNIRSVSTNLSRASEQFTKLVEAARIGREKLDSVSQSAQSAQTHSDHLVEANAIIQSIASQTNLLAMNAAIEAAHAGEAGRGFTVVAEEIRKLAENAAHQSKDIAANLKEIKQTIDLVVQTSSDAGEAFGNIEHLVHAVENLVQEIQQAMQEQNTGNQQVLEALKHMQSITMEVRDGSKEMTAGSNQILSEMKNLKDATHALVDQLQVISKRTDAITTVAEETERISEQNIEASTSLSATVGQFKCEG
ncbi:MAG: cache domain-containing protein [Termitinemataceae bacterium]